MVPKEDLGDHTSKKSIIENLNGNLMDYPIYNNISDAQENADILDVIVEFGVTPNLVHTRHSPWTAVVLKK